MTAIPYRKVDRAQVLREIKKLIEESTAGEVEISSSELADKFDVQAPTMDYHLNKLIEEGHLAISPRRGRYNRKIYRLPANGITKEEEKTDIITPENSEKFKQFLQEHIQKAKDKEPVQEEFDLEEQDEPEEEPEDVIVEEPIVQELSLDDRIKRFLDEANQVHDAHALLKHDDKEILSVMNETIHQTSVYLKDLSEQLSTLQNKELIQGLIDDRNRMQNQIARLELDVQEARAQADQTVEQYEISPERVRFMHQMIISTVDDYVNLPNHAMALGRKDFRSKVSKEVSDLVKYVLRLEE